jgi:hypothetical protein
MAKKNYYAVKVGRTPGVYTSWDACKAEVHGHTGAQFKGFATRQEADAYMAGSAAVPSTPQQGSVAAAASSTAPGAASRPAANAFSTLMAAPQAAARGGGGGGGGVQAGELAFFTDGACKGNQNVATSANPAGWGAVGVEGCLGSPPQGGHAIVELFGPVELQRSSPHFLGAEVRRLHLHHVHRPRHRHRVIIAPP